MAALPVPVSDRLGDGGTAPHKWFWSLGADAQRSHLVVAALVAELRGTGWEGPIGAAVVDTEDGPRVVIVTADGLSCLPPGVKLPAGVTPMSDLVPMGLVQDALGSSDVHAKLLAAAQAGDLRLVSPVVATGDSPSPAHTIQTPDMLAELRRAGLIPPSTVTPGAEVPAALLLSGQHAIPGRAEQMALRLRELRWERQQPPEYISVLTSWLIATAIEEGPDGGWYAAQAAGLWKRPKGLIA